MLKQVVHIATIRLQKVNIFSVERVTVSFSRKTLCLLQAFLAECRSTQA